MTKVTPGREEVNSVSHCSNNVCDIDIDCDMLFDKMIQQESQTKAFWHLREMDVFWIFYVLHNMVKDPNGENYLENERIESVVWIAHFRTPVRVYTRQPTFIPRCISTLINT